MLKGRFKKTIVRTPFEAPALRLEEILGYPHRARHPEFAPIFGEGRCIERFLRTTLSAESNCIDIGCHLGIMLSAFARIAPLGAHIAFEPIPEKAAWLRAKFPEYEIHETALSSRDDHAATFFINRDSTGYSGLNRHCEPGDELIETRVACRRLDDVLPPERRVDFIKVDVEGAELQVLLGAERILLRQRPLLLFESTQSALAAASVATRDVFDFLDRVGYSIFLPQLFTDGAAPLDLTSFHRAHEFPFAAFNFIGVPRGATRGQR